MKLKGKNNKEALEEILDFLYNMVTDGDELYDDDIKEILDYCREYNLNTGFKAINELSDYD